MNDLHGSPVPKWFRTVSVLAVLWNLIGCCMWCMEMFAQDVMTEGMTERQQEWVRSIPIWIYVVYGIAVLTGTLGSVGLLLRRRWSVSVLAISFILVVIQMVYPTFVAGGLEAMGNQSLIIPAIVISLAGVLLRLSIVAKQRGWFSD